MSSLTRLVRRCNAIPAATPVITLPAAPAILIQRIFLHAVNFCCQRRRFFSGSSACNSASVRSASAGKLLPVLYGLQQSAPFRLYDGFIFFDPRQQLANGRAVNGFPVLVSSRARTT